MPGEKRDRDGEEVTCGSGEPLASEYYFPLAQAEQAVVHLRTHGVAVVQGALLAEESRAALGAIQSWLAKWTSTGGWPQYGNGLVAAGACRSMRRSLACARRQVPVCRTCLLTFGMCLDRAPTPATGTNTKVCQVDV